MSKASAWRDKLSALRAEMTKSQLKPLEIYVLDRGRITLSVDDVGFLKVSALEREDSFGTRSQVNLSLDPAKIPVIIAWLQENFL